MTTDIGTGSPASISYDTAIIFAASATAYRINNGYVKVDRTIAKNKKDQRPANINILRRKIQNFNEILPCDFELGKLVQEHFQELMFELLADNLGKFLKDAHTISSTTKIEVNKTFSKSLSLIACLPHAYMQTLKRQEERAALKTYTDNSKPYGLMQDTIAMTLTVIDCIQKNHGRVRIIDAIDNLGNVFFFYYHQSTPILIGKKYAMRGTICAYHNNCTQLTNVIVQSEYTN